MRPMPDSVSIPRLVKRRPEDIHGNYVFIFSFGFVYYMGCPHSLVQIEGQRDQESST